MINYRNERYHDDQLIDLVNQLHQTDQLHLLRRAFLIEVPLGRLCLATRRQPFDVELSFSNMSVVIETKVDSDENGRWEEDWQTHNIASSAPLLGYLKPTKAFRFITYGTSEFYTKPYETGPASKDFLHIGLDRMVDLVESSNEVLPPCEDRTRWLRLMKIEQEKRRKAVELLQLFSAFRTEYLDVHKENDFPNNRFVYCSPELAFPVFSQLAKEWRQSQFARTFGKLAIYRVPRMSPPVHDSVLNFWELWNGGKLDIGPSIPNLEGSLYFEVRLCHETDDSLRLADVGRIV